MKNSATQLSFSRDIEVVGDKDIESCVSTMVLAFANDPGARWFSPTPELYLQNMTGYAQATGSLAVAHNGAFRIGNGIGTVFCLPPRVEVEETLLSEVLTSGLSDADQSSMGQLGEKSAQLRPDEEHWYLPMIGVDPRYQGLGLGTLLMETACRHFDKASLPAFLESSNPGNVPLYQRFGFEVLEVLQFGTSPTITLMWRNSRQ